MSEIAAKAPVKPARRRLLASRLVPYLLLQALIVIATILGLRLLQPSDPDDHAVTAFSLREDGVTRTVTLPHFTASRYSLADPPLYTGTFTFRSSDAASGWSVYLPRFSNAAEVAVNGVVFQRPGTRLLAATYGRSAFAMTFTPGTPTPAPASLTFSVEQGKPDPSSQQVSVTNSDIYGSILELSSIQSNIGWLSVTPDNGLKNDAYTVAMARTSNPNSATAQFFINVADNAFLNHTAPTAQGWGYAVFGRVVEGKDVVDRIKKVPTGNRGMHQDVPVEDVIIERAEEV